jgi:hypothetical protein
MGGENRVWRETRENGEVMKRMRRVKSGPAVNNHRFFKDTDGFGR